MATFNSINSNLPGNNTFLGSTAGKALTSGIENVGMGFDSLTDVTSGSNNVTLGNITGTSITTGSQNTLLGSGSGAFLVTGSNNVLIGYLNGSNYTTTESRNLIIGTGYSGSALDTNKYFFGFIDGVNPDVSFAHNIGTNNTFFGASSGNIALDTGFAIHNTAFGDSALAVLSTGNSNTAIGRSSCLVLTTGTANTAVGQEALANLTTGGNNTTIGQNAGVNYTTESANICIGVNVHGEVGDSAVTRIGDQAVQTKCFIAGTTGITPDNTNAKVMLMDSVGQMGTTAAATNGQILLGATGANPAWASLTAGTNITLTPGANSLTIAAAGGGGSSITWVNVSDISGPVTIQPNYGYRVNVDLIGPVILNMDASSAYHVGDTVMVVMRNNNDNFSIQINGTNNTIGYLGAYTTISSGTVSNTTTTATCMTMVCLVDGVSTTFYVTSATAGLTVS